jgi:hypothetical protein
MLVVDLCAFEMHAGHAEMMLARMQAAVEYSCFPPDSVCGASEATKVFNVP